MPMYDVPNLPSEKMEGPEVSVRRVTMRVPVPENEKLIDLLTNILRTRRVTYINIYPKEITYEYVLPDGVDEILDWFQTAKGD